MGPRYACSTEDSVANRKEKRSHVDANIDGALVGHVNAVDHLSERPKAMGQMCVGLFPSDGLHEAVRRNQWRSDAVQSSPCARHFRCAKLRDIVAARPDTFHQASRWLGISQPK